MPGLDVSITFPPWQMVVLPFAVITGTAGLELTVTVIGVEVDVQPEAFAMVTE